jgi:hypothetical protein
MTPLGASDCPIQLALTPSAFAVEHDHGVVRCQPHGDRATDRAGAAGHDGDTAMHVCPIGH